MIYLVFAGLAIAIVAFGAGMIIPVAGKAGFSAIRNRAGYIASFGAGALLMAVFFYVSQPYTVARWAGLYDEAILGSLITSGEQIMQTGQIPQDVRDWYVSRQK